MDASEVFKIKDLIRNAEAESLRAQGAVDSIKKQWKDDYGTDDPVDIAREYDRLNEEYESLKKRQEEVFEKLSTAVDWDDIAKRLGR